VQAGAPQGLVGVDVADAADQGLVEQGPFDGGALAAQGEVECLVVEERVERVAGDVRDDVGQAVGAGLVQGEAAEGALVDEAEFGAEGVGEADADAQVLLGGRLVRLDQELAAHAEVGEDRLTGVLQGQPQVLAAAAGRADAVALQAVGEVVGAGDVPAHGARVQDLGVGDGAVGDPALQAAPDDLDLGQLGHGIPSGGPVDEPNARPGSGAGVRDVRENGCVRRRPTRCRRPRRLRRTAGPPSPWRARPPRS
jgi:hypothetical protein